MGSKESPERPVGAQPVAISELNRRATLKRGQPEAAARLRFDDIVVSEEYKAVCDLLAAGRPVVFVTGNAGTGKSTLIRYLKNVIEKQSVVLAPTGVAALNVEGATIHSFFHFPPRILDEEDIKLVRDRKLYRRLELLIIDEVSMVRCDLMDGIDRFLRKNRGSSEPFGGVQLLLIGDLFQLPPVVPRQEADALKARGYASPHFFSAFGLQSTSLVPVELTSVYRQEDPAFVDMLNRIRVGDGVDEVTAELNRQCCGPGDVVADVTLTCTNNKADNINSAELRRLPTQEYTFTGGIEGRFSLDDDRLPSPIELKLKENAHVMFTRNDDQHRWVNGTMGIVREVSHLTILVEVVGPPSGLVYDVTPVTWETYRYSYDSATDRIVAEPVGTYTQYPLMLAWAVTIHKSQGKTMDNVLVDLGSGAFASGQAYVALSRCRTLEGMRLARAIRPADIICDPIVKRFYLALSGTPG
jgi:ATP-dependent DNA helicase PIF1